MRRPTEQPGLRHRMTREKNRISWQHDLLHVLCADLAGALSSGDAEPAQSTFKHLRGALEAHFSLEEQQTFPALHGLAPGMTGDLLVLVKEHHAFADDLDRLHQAITRRDLTKSSEQLEELVRSLRSHEAREEALFHPADAGAKSPD